MRATALFALALAACTGAPVEKPADPVEDAALGEPENIITPTDFAALTLGGTMPGSLGPVVEASLVADGEALGDIESRVQCPDGMNPCNPANAEKGTIYTYIHKIRPGFDGPNDPPFDMPEKVVPVERASSFGLAFPAHGFTGIAGYYSVYDAEDMPADRLNASISCIDSQLIWSFPDESGWSTGETITFFWQSTQPPTGPDGEYRFVADDREAIGMGPLPREGGEIAAVCE